jgi:LacI family transcriptional regulator
MIQPFINHRVTLRDIARRLNVTHTTISRALRDSHEISPALRVKINRVAKEMGYRPDPMLAALAHYRRSSVKTPISSELAWINVWPNPKELHKRREFALYWRGAFAEAERCGFRLEEFSLGQDMTMTRLKQIFRARNIEGLLLPPTPPGLIPVLDDFSWDEFCVVRFGHSIKHPKAHLVASDQMSGGLIAFENIRQHGYRRIGLVTNEFRSKNLVRFAAGYLFANFAVPEAERLSPLILAQNGILEETKALRVWLKGNQPDAILTDLASLREMLSHVGYRVPQDAALAAMSVLDGNAEAGIDQNSEEIGRAAVQVLVSLINQNERGIPKICREVLIEGRWIDGPSLPPKNKAFRSALKSPPLSAKMKAIVIMIAAIVIGSFFDSNSRAAEIDFSKVDAQVQQWIDARYYPGAGLWITDKNGQTLHEHYWKGYTRETTVMIASSTKWLEAACLMTIVDAGKLDLDKPISIYLPEMKGSPAGQNTLREMFAHTSSLNHIPINDNLGTDTFPAQLAAGKTDVKPGQEFLYGGTDLATGSRVIEVVAGKPWLTVFGENIARPCRMKKTVSGHNLWTYSNVVQGDLFPCSNAADYMNFLQMILHDGVFDGQCVLSPNAVQEMEADQIRDATVKQPEYPELTFGQKHKSVYGLGEWRLVLDGKGEAVILSSPSFAGFFPWVDKKHGIAGVFVGRATGGGPGFDAFHDSARIAKLVGEALDSGPGLHP